MLCWYALHSKPRREFQVRENLTEREIDVYVTSIPVRRKRGETRRVSFPCYLFAHADLDTVGLWGTALHAGRSGRIHGWCNSSSGGRSRN